MVAVGAPGRRSDGGILRDSKIGAKFERNLMDLPPPSQICDDGPALPYFLVADEAFGLSKYMQRPFPGRNSGTLAEGQRVFNYRLSRARRVIENSFGILASKWRIFRQPIQASKEKVEAITLAAVCLHNVVLMEESDCKPHQRTYLHPKMADRYDCFVEGDWRKDPEPIHHCTFTNYVDDESENDDSDGDEIEDSEEIPP